MNYQKIYETCLSIINNPVYQGSYTNDPAQFLANLGVTELPEQQAINNLLIPVLDFRQLEINTVKQRMDYNKKLNILFDILHNTQAAAFFESSPAEYLNSIGIFTPPEQQQIIDLITPVKEFQQLLINNRQAKSDYEGKLARLKTLLQNSGDASLYLANPQQYFSNAGIDNPQDQQEISELFLNAQKVQEAVTNYYIKQSDVLIKQTEEVNTVNSSYRESLSKANKQTIQGFKGTMIMYNVSFYTGIALIIMAVIAAFVIKSSLFTIVFGSIGTLDLLTFFIANPPLRLQQSRAEQAKLNAAFYSWFLDLYNWNSFYLQYSKQGAAGQFIPFEIVKQVSDAQIENTKKLMEIISNHINIEAAK